jgi:hypothetical protein
MPVFGRDYVWHPLDRAIEEMARHATPALRALSKNFAHDHRVTEARDESLRRHGEEPWTPSALQEAVVRYQYEQVRTRRLPEFVYRALNESNIIAGDGRICRFNRSVPLARILDLNGLITVYQWARSRGIEPFARWTPWPVSDEEIARRLDATLNGASPEEIEDFVDAALQALTSYAAAHAYQPAWCTTWADFEPNIDQGIDRWLEAVGIASKGVGRWILLLRYPIRAVGTLVRPTQLDVGWDARGHFPSPPDAPIWRGGHAMDLAGHNTLKRLLPEYIHRQIPHTLNHWHDAGRRLGVTTRHALNELVMARTSHHSLLAFHYGASIYDWMPKAI